MNSSIQRKDPTPPFVVMLLLASFGLAWLAHAVVPPPDGGYPGGNTAEGQAALLSLTSGGFNTAVGWLALRSNTENGFNTAVGAGALLANISAANTATGAGALLSTTTGGNNTASGALALFSNMTGQSNTATGAGALFSNTTSDNNTGTGFQALFSNTTGHDNTALGSAALGSNTTANNNTAIGSAALIGNVTGSDNTAVGLAALNSSAGSGNTALGSGAGNSVVMASNVICIGAAGADVNDSCYINNIWNQPGGSQAVYVNSDGKLGAQVSSRRFKDDIKPVDKASEAIYALKPVSFRYKPEIEPTRPVGYGLIAEDVQKISADLVICGIDGQVNSVRYDAVNAMLLNEFLKEHRKNEKQEATITRLQKQIDALTESLQKVSAQLEVIKPAPQTVLNSH
jgi:hypothetical protein